MGRTAVEGFRPTLLRATWSRPNLGDIEKKRNKCVLEKFDLEGLTLICWEYMCSVKYICIVYLHSWKQSKLV